MLSVERVQKLTRSVGQVAKLIFLSVRHVQKFIIPPFEIDLKNTSW